MLYSHLEKSVTHECLLYAKTHLLFTMSRVLPVGQSMTLDSKAGLQVWPGGRPFVQYL